MNNQDSKMWTDMPPDLFWAPRNTVELRVPIKLEGEDCPAATLPRTTAGAWVVACESVELESSVSDRVKFLDLSVRDAPDSILDDLDLLNRYWGGSCPRPQGDNSRVVHFELGLAVDVVYPRKAYCDCNADERARRAIFGAFFRGRELALRCVLANSEFSVFLRPALEFGQG